MNLKASACILMLMAKASIGRPSSFDQRVATRIFERLEANESMRSICRDPRMPALATIFRWLADDRYYEFREQLGLAKEMGLEALAEEILLIADAPVGRTESGATDAGAVQKQRLQVDTRKWLLSKLLPKKYGDRLGIDRPVAVSLRVVTGVPCVD